MLLISKYLTQNVESVGLSMMLKNFGGGGQLSNLFILFTTLKAASEHAYALSLSILIIVTQVTS